MEKLAKVSDLFTVKYGVNLELVNLTECSIDDPDAIFFVSRTGNNNGVAATVKRLIDVEPNPAHTLSVAGGGSVLSTFYQPKTYYSGRDLYVLIPRGEINVIEMLFYAYCIQLNKYKYNYGRQANRTLKNLLIPSVMPVSFQGIEKTVLGSLGNISTDALSVEYKKMPQLNDEPLALDMNFDETLEMLVNTPLPKVKKRKSISVEEAD